MAKFLLNGLKGREPMMIEPNVAMDYYKSAMNLGMVDNLVQMVAERPAPTTQGVIAIIPLMGVIGKGLSSLEKALGGADLNDFRKAWNAAEADPNVSEIWAYVNSPGGSAIGVEEIATMVRNTTKPTTSYVDEIAASAGYYVASATDRVIVAPSAVIGSIGVRMVIEDWSKAYENAGITIRSLTSGSVKGGGDGAAITDAELMEKQAYVDELGARFRSDVKLTRSSIPDSAMQGQIYTGRRATQLGLATGLADSLEIALKTSRYA